MASYGQAPVVCSLRPFSQIGCHASKGMHPRSLQSLRNGVKVAETLKPLVGTDGLLATIVGLKWAAIGNRRAPV